MAETKPNVFVRFGKGIARFFRDGKAEVKKVVWPKPSTASILSMGIRATSARPAAELKAAVFWMCWSWTPPPTTVWIRFAPCGMKQFIRLPR